MERLDDLVRKMQSFGFANIRRIQYKYDLQGIMNIISKIGTYRTPNFVIDDDNRFAYVNAVKWLMGDPTMQAIDPTTNTVVKGRLNAGLYVAGNTGTGKSWLLDILNSVALMYHLQYYDGEVNCGLQWNAYRCDDICDDYSVKGDLRSYKSMRTICLHDFGSEPEESLYMGNRQNVIRHILESRGDRSNLFTHITSNIPMNHDRVHKRYGDRVCSRLNDMCNYLTIKGADRRKH